MVRKASGGIASLLILVFVWIVPVVFGVVVARNMLNLTRKIQL
jgi:hypothetical protein